jgi:PTS system mannose-specific IID component
MLAFALGARPLAVLLIFLVLYNVGHLGLRIWGLRAGWRDGLRVASALGSPVLRQGPSYVARAAALVAGIALPSLLVRSVGTAPAAVALVLASALAVGATLVRFHGRLESWRAAIFALAVLAIYSIIR